MTGIKNIRTYQMGVYVFFSVINVRVFVIYLYGSKRVFL